jgi:hypothetical protein
MPEELDFIGRWKTRANDIVEIVGRDNTKYYGFIGGGFSKPGWWHLCGNHPVKKELDLVERINGFCNPRKA